MANNLSLGIVVGASTSASVGQVFRGINAQASQLGRSLQQVRLGRAASEDVIRYRSHLNSLNTVQNSLGGSNAYIARQISETERHLRTATTAAARYSVNIGDIVRENARLTQSERILSGQLQRSNTRQANRAQRSELGGQMLGTAGMAIGAAYALAGPIRETMQFESVMANVRKVVDMTDTELKTLGKSILDMSTTMPMAASGIGAIVAAAGQSGIAKNELLGFTQSAVKMGVAFDMTGEQAGEMMASFRAGMALSQPEVENLADAINYLDSNMNASAKNISDVVQRQGAVARAAGLSAIQTAALSAALLNSGAPSEIAATALKNLTNALTQGGSASKAQNKVFEQLGLTSKEVTSGMQKDAEGTIKNVFQRLAKMPAEMRGAMVGDLFGEEAKGAIMPLLVNVKALDQAFGAVAESTKYAGSMQKEYEIRSKTTANNAQLLSNKFDALKIHVGSALLPALNEVFGVIGDLAMKIGAFSEKFPVATQAITGLGVGLIGLKFAMLGGAYVASLLSTGWTIASGAAAFFSSGLALQKIQVIGATIAQQGMALWTGTVTAAQWLWNAALSANPIGLVIIGIAAFAALAFTVYKNWEPITAWFGQAWATIGGYATALGGIVSNAFSSMAASVRGIWEPLMAWLSGQFAWLSAAITQVKGYASEIGSVMSSVGKFMTTPLVGTPAVAGVAPGAGTRGSLGDLAKKGKGAAIGGAMAATLALPAGANTPLPPLPNANSPKTITNTTNATIHVTQKPGEDSNALADRVVSKIKRQEAADKRGALHD